MSKKLRFFILFFGTLLFIITAPILIAYSIGYRYDFENKRVVKKGVLVLWAENSDVEILINDEKIENTETKSSGLINKYLNSKGSLFEIELLPGSYTIKLQKEGYVAWEKRLNIKSGYATIADGIHLFPENPEIKKIGGENIQIASFAEDGKKAYWIEEDSSLTVFDFSKKKVETALSQKDIKGLTLDKNFLFVSKDSKSILFKALDSKRNTHFLILDISLKKPKVHNITSELAKMTISDLSSENFTWHPKDSKKLLVLHKENVYEIDILEEDKTPKLLLDNILTLTSNKDKIYFIQKDNTQNPKPILQQAIFSYDLKNIRIRKILELPKGKYIKIIPSSTFLSSLTFFSTPSRVLTEISRLSFNKASIGFTKMVVAVVPSISITLKLELSEEINLTNKSPCDTFLFAKCPSSENFKTPPRTACGNSIFLVFFSCLKPRPRHS